MNTKVIGIFRPANCALATLAVFVPIAIATGDLAASLSKATPLLLITMCTFVLNDLADIESDRINHPERALPSGGVSETMAAGVYFGCLGLALITIRIFLRPAEATLYYILLLLVVNYNYVVEYFPSWKSTYVGVTTAVPMFIVAESLPGGGGRYHYVAAAVALFNLGREVCKDIIDIPGDKESIVHRLSFGLTSSFALILQAAALTILVFQVDSILDTIGFSVIVCLQVGSVYFWFARRSLNFSVRLMKVTLFAGVVFLL